MVRPAGRPAPVIKALIFDLDGTLIDNKEANFLAYQKAFKSIGVGITRSQYSEAFGLRADDLLRRIHPPITASQIELVRTAKAVEYKKVVGRIRLNEELVRTARYLKPHHQMALATTASRINAEFVLDYFGIGTLFDLIIYGEDVVKGKPDPECYITCIQRLGVAADECLIFEDSAVGVEAGRSAGAAVIQIKGF